MDKLFNFLPQGNRDLLKASLSAARVVILIETPNFNGNSPVR